MPITLISFTASVVNGEVILNWTTSAEMHNDYFTIQRSKDVLGWGDIQKVPGAGNSGNTISYSAHDPSPYSGLSYYRLMQTDMDGKQTYSFVISVTLGNKETQWIVYPNPATDQIHITFAVSGKYEVALFNRSGQLMNNPVLITGNSTVLNVSDMKTGIYLIHIIHDGNKEIRKILISK